MFKNKVLKTLKSKKMVTVLLGALAGGGIGFLYYYFIGCAGNSCPITSNPYSSILIGIIFGILFTI